MKNQKQILRRKTFSQFVHQLFTDEDSIWKCCDKTFQKKKEIDLHVSKKHMKEILEKVELMMENNKQQSIDTKSIKTEKTFTKLSYLSFDVQNEEVFICKCKKQKFVVILFYKYVQIEKDDLKGLCLWQENVCENSNLTGKLKLATEGINGTLEGCSCSINYYKHLLISHPVFKDIILDDFKESDGNGNSFDCLKVSIVKEICTMGISPEEVKSDQGGRHLTPAEFRQKIIASKQADDSKKPLLIDCRNFYESKIGKFQGALAPDIRKFSYFPEYVDKNQMLFDKKEVVMYCTGGIRCERASAYIKKFTSCSDVSQLKGGIHKYLEQFPDDNLYKGKLFVFDNRLAIGGGNKDPISTCFYCSSFHDQYRVCSSRSCSQLVLICNKCFLEKNLTSCCSVCASNDINGYKSEECSCTEQRNRIPRQNLS